MKKMVKTSYIIIENKNTRKRSEKQSRLSYIILENIHRIPDLHTPFMLP